MARAAAADEQVGGSGARRNLYEERERGAWVMRRNSGPAAERKPRSLDEPSYTIRASGSGSHPAGVEWVFNRPATSVNADPRISAPGRDDPEVSGSQQAGAIRVTPQEAACLQSFPDGWPFQGPKTRVFQQIGNAVPALLGRAVLKEVTS